MNQDVLRFEVTVDNREGMRVVQPVDDLLEVAQRLEWSQLAAVDKKVEQLAPLDVLQDEVQLFLTFVHIINTHNVRVVHKLHHRDLSIDSKTLFLLLGLSNLGRWVRSVGVDERLEWENLDGGELTCSLVSSDLHVSARAFADTLADDPWANELRVVGVVERTRTGGGFLVLPAGAERGIVLDGGARGGLSTIEEDIESYVVCSIRGLEI